MDSTMIIGILGGVVLVGFFAYNIYDSYIKKDTKDTSQNTNKNNK